MSLSLNTLLQKYVGLSVLLFSLLTLPASAVAQTPSARSQTSGVLVCDTYLAQIEVCMKTQIPPENYADLEDGLETARRAILYSDDKDAVAQACREAIEEARRDYASKGCTFN